MDICSQCCFELLSSTLFALSLLIAGYLNRLPKTEAMIVSESLCVFIWMFTTLFSLVFSHHPTMYKRKFRSSRSATIYWLIITFIAPLLVPSLIALAEGIPYLITYIATLSLSLSVRGLTRFLKPYENQGHQDNQSKLN